MKSSLFVLFLISFAVSAKPTYGHGFGERYDLPLPLWLYVYGAGATVALSFVIIGLLVKGDHKLYCYPTLSLQNIKFFKIIFNTYLRSVIKITSSALLLLVVISGLFGTQNPYANISPTLVWVIWWVGIAYVSALVGNIWQIINPWDNIFSFFELCYSKLTKGRTFTPQVEYDYALAMWPGVVFFFIFAWIELVYPYSSLPKTIALLTIIYSFITWTGMFFVGKHIWLQYIDPFSIAFRFLSKFSPTEIRCRNIDVCKECPTICDDTTNICINCYYCFSKSKPNDREINLRPLGVGLLADENISTSNMAFVILILSTVTFDGLTSTPLWGSIQDSMFISMSAVFGNNALTGIESLGLILFPCIFFSIYLAFCKIIGKTSITTMSAYKIGKLFVYSLIPIALAYHLSHYLTYILIQGQLILPLLSDPLGLGWNVIGLSDYEVNIDIVGAKFAWITAVISIVVGHIIAVYVSHIIAIRNVTDRAKALRSQYPMLVFMVGYTTVSLWIIAQPIVEKI